MDSNGCIFGAQVFAKASLGHVLASGMSADCIHNGLEAYKQAQLDNSFLAGAASEDQTHIADHMALLQFEEIPGSKCCAMVLVSKGINDLVCSPLYPFNDPVTLPG